MLSLIDVECPYCGALGQIVTPPIGAIIIGPCPQCNELVVVFCGHVLPLNRTEMESNQVDDRRKHLLGVLTEFLEDRIYNKLPDQDFFDQSSKGHESTSEGQGPIANSEVERFNNVDLKLLDNKDYFRSVFETHEKK